MPAEEILINDSVHETRVAVVQQGALQELHLERAATHGLVGNVYLGKVTRVLPGMQSAFVECGLERAAFIHVADLWQARQAQPGHTSSSGQAAPSASPQTATSPTATTSTNGQHHIPIEKILYEGQSLLVEVLKDPISTKGARLTTQISIAGRLLVYLPHDGHLGVSQKIESEEERNHLRAMLQSLRPPDEKGGFIVRTSAGDASEENLKADMEYLRKRWKQVLEASRLKPAPSLLYQELRLSERTLRDLVNTSTQRILVDSAAALKHLSEFAQAYTPSVLDRLKLHTGDRPLFELHAVEGEIERALSKRVDLKSGGYLIIDQTEALTSVDVNTGGYVSGRNFDDTIFKTNLEAAHAIARQLRIRNLGGIIIIDFIDMANLQHREAVLQELRRAVAKDHTKTSVSGFTSLGLVEMTRKRTRESLAHLMCEACDVCQGKGAIKTARTICFEILREIDREARQFNPKEFRIIGSQNVIDMFLEEESQALASLGDTIGKRITLQVETQYPQEQYDIVLS
jgi:ribonuclease G